MTAMKNLGLCCAIFLLLAMAFSVPAQQANDKDKKNAEKIPPVKDVRTSAEAVKMAAAVDLPLINKADKIVLEQLDEFGAKTGKKVTLDKREPITKLTDTLKPKVVPEVGAAASVRVTFYQGDQALRTIYVIQDLGNWWIERPKMNWATGQDPALWKAIKPHLK